MANRRQPPRFQVGQEVRLPMYDCDALVVGIRRQEVGPPIYRLEFAFGDRTWEREEQLEDGEEREGESG